jgi:hypothetical protein
VSHEAKRGCGYRKPGGLYLVAGKLSAPCGKLPIPLHVCTTCGSGIKPQRAWQWIMPRLLFSGAECRYEVCPTCPLGGAMPERGGLLWVGGAYYKAPEDFMREAMHQGISRRIPTVPKGFEPYKTMVYLAHREVVLPFRDGKHEVASTEPCPAVFSAFIPTAVEYVVKGDEGQEVLDRLEKRGLSLVKVERQQGEPPLAEVAHG